MADVTYVVRPVCEEQRDHSADADFLQHFRMEERQGRMTGGTLLDDRGQSTYLGLFTQHDYPTMAFQRKRGVWIPSVYKSIGEHCTPYTASFQKANSADAPINTFDASSFIGAGKLLETRVGDFNGDGDVDVAYVVDDPTKGIVSYVFFKEPLQYLENRTLWNMTWERILVQYVEAFGTISPRTQALFKKAVNAYSRLDEAGLSTNWMLDSVKNVIHAASQKRPKASSDVDAYLSLIGKMEDDPKRLYEFTRRYRRFDDINAFFTRGQFIAFERLLDVVGDFSKSSALVDLFKALANSGGYDGEMFELIMGSLAKLGRELSADEITALAYVVEEPTLDLFDARVAIWQFVRRSMATPAKKFLAEAYRLFGCPPRISPATLARYREFFDERSPRPKLRDILAAEKVINAESAHLLWKKFGIVRFGRYHPTLLTHLVQLAKDPNYMKDKPLILAVVAEYDHTNMFYWGQRFKHDPRVRIVVVEVPDYVKFRDRMWDARREYGIPDVVLLTNHGSRRGITFGNKNDGNNTSLDTADVAQYEQIKRDFSGYFGGKKAQIVINACSTGAEPARAGDEEMNFAQMMANVFDVEVRAARDGEGLLSLALELTKDRRARLNPTFFETGLAWFGFNFGGEVFLPQKEGERIPHVYRKAADQNVGLQIGGGMSLVGSRVFLDARGGYARAFFHRLRLRGDAAVHVNPANGDTSLTFDPEVALGVTNHGMIAVGGSLGERLTNARAPYLRGSAAFKFVIPAIHGELDIGAATANGWHPAFFLGAQSRW